MDELTEKEFISLINNSQVIDRQLYYLKRVYSVRCDWGLIIHKAFYYQYAFELIQEYGVTIYFRIIDTKYDNIIYRIGNGG